MIANGGMTNTLAQAQSPARRAREAVPTTTSSPLPTGLLLLLGVFALLGVNIAVVLYLAAQMP